MELNIYWKSLKNEIDAETWKSAKCYITEDKAEERAEAQTGNEVLDINYCYRKVEQGLTNLQYIAHRFVNYMAGYTIKNDLNHVQVGDIIRNGISDSTKFSSKVTEIGQQEGSAYPKYILENGATILFSPTESEGRRFRYQIGSGSQYINPEHLSAADASDADLSDNKMRNNVVLWNVVLDYGDRQNIDARLLAAAFHKYCVLNVLQEWSKITLPSLTQEYQTRLAAEEVRIKQLMYRKEEPDWNE